MKLSSSENYLVREARMAVSHGKLATAAAYLSGLPDCYEVRSAREYLRSARADRDSYAEMSDAEREAHDNE